MSFYTFRSELPTGVRISLRTASVRVPILLSCVHCLPSGHLLGMGHDGSVGCDWSEYIMSRSRAVHGQTSWSSCSKASLASQSVHTRC